MKSVPSVIALVSLVLSVTLYLASIGPLRNALARAKADLVKEESDLSATRLAIAQAVDVGNRIVALEATNNANRATMLAPLLNSYAMRVKAVLSDIAFESGLVDVEYEEGSLRALPLPNGPIPERRTARRTVRVKALADYAAAASFLLRAEKTLPLMTLQAFSMTPAAPGADGADRQRVEMILEWPCEGEVIK